MPKNTDFGRDKRDAHGAERRLGDMTVAEYEFEQAKRIADADAAMDRLKGTDAWRPPGCAAHGEEF